MIKAWIKMWKSTFDYKGMATRKEYWLGVIANVIFMYIAMIPYALIFGRWMKVPMTPLLIIFFVIIFLPELSLYVRRARDAGWRTFTAVWLAVFMPVISGIFAGIYQSAPRDENGQIPKGPLNIIGYCMAVGFGLYMYSMVLGVAFFDGNFDVLSGMTTAGLLIMVAPLILYGILNWREVLRLFCSFFGD